MRPDKSRFIWPHLASSSLIWEILLHGDLHHSGWFHQPKARTRFFLPTIPSSGLAFGLTQDKQRGVPVVMHPALPPRHAVCARCSWAARGTAGLRAVQLGCAQRGADHKPLPGSTKPDADRQTRPECNCNCSHYTLQISRRRRRRRRLRRLRRWLRVLQGTAGQLSSICNV